MLEWPFEDFIVAPPVTLPAVLGQSFLEDFERLYMTMYALILPLFLS